MSKSNWIVLNKQKRERKTHTCRSVAKLIHLAAVAAAAAAAAAAVGLVNEEKKSRKFEEATV